MAVYNHLFPGLSILVLSLILALAHSSSTPQGTVPSSIFIDASSINVPNSKSISVSGAFQSSSQISPIYPNNLFRRAREGADLRFARDLPSTFSQHTLSISIGVIEPTCNTIAEKRSFSVFIDDKQYINDYNVAEAANGCLTPHIIDIPYHTPTSKSVTIRFKSSSANALIPVNFIKISFRQRTDCVPATAVGKLLSDHSAHAVPGTYEPVTNANNLRKVNVVIDGSASHTHFFNPELDMIGVLTDVTWENLDTNVVISKKLRFSYSFNEGTTRLRLTVRDNSCDEHSAVTLVTVLPQRQNGMYCEYFPVADSFNMQNQPLDKAIRGRSAQFGHSVPTLRANFWLSPFAFSKFILKCTASLKMDASVSKVSIDTAESGIALMYNAQSKQILNGFNGELTRDGNANTWNDVTIYYGRTTITKTANLAVSVGGRVPKQTQVSFNVKSITPSITGVFPSVIRVGVESKIRLTGHALHPPSAVLVNNVKTSFVADPGDNGNSEKELYVTLPVPSTVKTVKVSIENAAGRKSNTVDVMYRGSSANQCGQPSFRNRRIVTRTEDQVDWIRQPTSVTIGPDNRMYIGTLNGSVAVLGYDADSLQATTYCYSDALTDSAFVDDGGKPSPRSILGIAFNPIHGDNILPYVSVSTVNFWQGSRIKRSIPSAWKNGAIERLKISADPSSFVIGKRSGRCIVRDTKILTGLPVANGGSHSVNSIVFTDNGDMLVSIGGSTNMGIPGVSMGNLWESPISASIIRLPSFVLMTRSNLPYDIPYSGGNAPHTATLDNDNQVKIHATGLRNLFTMTVALNGEVFAVDQGPGCPLGGAPKSCSTYSKETYDQLGGVDMTEDWPSPFKGDEGKCSGTRREDKVLKIQRGAFYGHANIARGECQWVDPLTDSTLDNKKVTKYTKPLAMLPASVTSIVEYASGGRFCGQLKGKLVMSTYRGVSTWWMNKFNSRKNFGKLNQNGGTSFVEDALGNLIFPRLTERYVNVMVPDDQIPVTQLAVFGVVPRRIKRAGRVTLWIGGNAFQNRFGQFIVKDVMVGNAKCVVQSVSKGLIKCTAPSRENAGAKLVSIKVITSDGKSATLNSGLAYLNR